MMQIRACGADEFLTSRRDVCLEEANEMAKIKNELFKNDKLCHIFEFEMENFFSQSRVSGLTRAYKRALKPL